MELSSIDVDTPATFYCPMVKPHKACVLGYDRKHFSCGSSSAFEMGFLLSFGKVLFIFFSVKEAQICRKDNGFLDFEKALEDASKVDGD